MSPRKHTADESAALRASLLEHARRLIARDGGPALTMRALAAEAGCAVGLPYKVFTDRRELVLEIVHAEFARLDAARDQLVARAGTGPLADNLAWFAELMLDSPAVALAREIFADETLTEAVAARVHETGAGPGSFEATFASYLAAEQQPGRVAPEVDADAVGFLLAGAVHNLVVSGPAYPGPTRGQLRQHLAAIADRLRPDKPRPPT